MEQLLTANVATNLYWFGRYLERVETTLKDTMALFDLIIDSEKEAGKAYFAELGIALEYANASHFLHGAVFGGHEGNLHVLMEQARENAIICRSQIDTEAFGEVIKLHELFEHAAKGPGAIDTRFFDHTLSLINEIWGALSCGMDRRLSDHFIQLGKLVEKSDLNLRHGKEPRVTHSYIKEIIYTAKQLAPDAEVAIDPTDPAACITALNGLIGKIVTE